MSESQLKENLKKQQGSWSVAAQNFSSKSKEFYFQENRKASTSSIIKLAIAAAIFEKIEKGELSETQKIKLLEKDKIIGTGVLKLFKSDLNISLLDAITLMISLSDNIATNLCLKTIGQEEVNDFLLRKGFVDTKLDEKYLSREIIDDIVYRRKKRPFGYATAKEMLGFVERLLNFTLLKEPSCQKILDMMRNQQADVRFSRYLPTLNNFPDDAEIIDFGSKSGESIFPMTSNNAGFLINKKGERIGIAIFVEEISNSRLSHYSIDHETSENISRIIEDIYKLIG